MMNDSLLFGIFEIKKWVALSLTSFRTLKYDCVIKTSEVFSTSNKQFGNYWI